MLNFFSLSFTDERDRVQKKTFTKWVNKHLIKTQRHVNDLYEDLRDGHILISLLEVLSGETLPRERDVVRSVRLPRERGRMRFHKLQNVQIALDFLRRRQVKLVNIRNDDIADGNPKLTLGLIWTIILHFQISDIQVNGQSDDMSAKEKLLLWSQRMVEGYSGIRCDNFTTSWRDGKLFNAVIHKHEPRFIDMGKVYRQTNLENLEQAFTVAERELGVTRLLDPEDVDVPHPDEKSIITYVSSLYDAMPRVPDVQDGVKASALEVHWHEYYELVTILLQWIRHHVLIFEERKFPGSYEEVEILWRQFLKFKETELPAKESDKSRSKHLYQSFESAVHAGQVKVPPGYHPVDVEKEWGRLHVSVLERERLLRIEFERLERLQQIVSKVQIESGMCEEQINQTESLLQTDIRLLSAGKPAQHAAEVERDLDKADGMIRLLFNDVQLLKDGRHLQAEQMYRRVYRLHERLVNLRSDYNLRLKSSRARPELDEVTLRYAQDLLSWVEENQRRIDTAEWGIDLPSVESQLGSHRGLQQTIEDFRAKIERARTDENQLSPASKGTYREYLGKLDLQYNRLLNSSKSRLRNLDQLYNFVSAATKELKWLSDKEEEEVNYDWSERNTNMAAKKENYSGLMRELELREKKINDIQATGDRLIKDGHPGKKTVESFTAALQTQWSWILQVCCCIENHLRENTAYFQFFADVRDAEERMKKMQETMKKKYMCDRSTTSTRLEDLLQDAVEEREQLNEFKSDIANLNKRAKSIVQLKTRNPTSPFRGKLPIQAVCDFKQMEITMHKGDECALINNSQPFRWKVLNRSGNEAVVPSICFLVPPVNKEAVESVSSLEAGHQQTLTLWQKLHADLRSLLSWQYLMKDIHLIRSWNITMFKTMKTDEYQLMLRNLQLHYQDFLKDSKDSKLFDSSDNMQIERDYKETVQHYDSLLRTLEKGEQDESICKTYITQIKNLRLQVEDCESRTVARIRQPVDKDPLRDCMQKTADQKKVQIELDGIKKNLDRVSQKAEEVLSSPEQSSTPVLRSELDITLQKMDQTYNLSSLYLEKLKTIEIVIRNTQGAEDVVKKYENRLREVHTVPTNVQEVENYCSELKRMRSDAETQRPVFDDMESELAKATAVSQRMLQVHSERDAELDHYRQLLGSRQDRWRAVFAQIDLRQRELEQLGRQLGYYRESYDWLIRWIADAKQRQEKIQAVPIIDSKTLKEQLAQEKKLLEEIEKNKEKVDECQKYAKAYIDTIKDYELQLVAYKAQAEPLTSSLKKPKMESASDNIIQEYVTLRTRYSELMTLTSQYIKFITDSQRRIEDEEKAAEKLKAEERKKMAEMQAELEKQKQLAEAHAKAIAKAEKEAQELKLMMQEEVSKREIVAVDAERQKQNIQLELHELKNLSEQQIKSKSQQVDEALLSRSKIEEEIRIIRLQLETTLKQKSTAEDELRQLRDKAAEAERLRKAAQEEAEKLRKQVNEETQKKRMAEEELKLKSEAEKEAARQKQKALDDLAKHKMQAEEAERHMKQAEIEKDRQIKLAQDVAQKSAAAELQSKRMSFVEKTSKLEESLREKHGTVMQLQEEAERLKKQQEEADKAREEAEKELEKWRQKANEALRLRLQAEEEAHKKTLAQEDAEKQKDEAEREAKKRAKAEESALKQKDMAEQELERQRKLAESTAQQKLSAEQELIRLRADFDHAEQQRSLLDNELYRLKNEISAAEQQRKQLEDELSKVRSEMDILLQLKSKAEKDSMSTTEKSKQLLEAEAAKLRDLADEAAKLRAIAEEAKRQRQVAEEEAARQRAEAERILKEKLAAINEATRLKTEADIALKEKEAENERLRRKAEDEAYQRKALEDQASQHKQDIDQKIEQLKKSSEMELDRQKSIVDDTLKQKRIVEEEIRILKVNFEKASSGKLDLELELNKLKNIAEETQQSKLRVEEEAEKLRKLALHEENRRREAEEKLKKITAAEQEAARQCQSAQGEVERLKKKADEARKQKEDADKEAERQILAAREAAEKAIAAEHQVHNVLVQQKEDSLVQKKLKEEFEKAKKLAQEAEKAKEKAEKEAALLRQQAEDAERQRQAAEVEAANQAKAQEDAERLRKEAELEAEKRAQAEAAALKQKQLADEEMARHKTLAEQTLKQKSQVEQELAKVKLRLDETDKQKTLLDDELHRLKDEVSDAVKQKAQVEEELFKVKIQMEELIKLKLRIEEENQRLIQKDRDNTQKLLAEEAENMKKLAEDAARLSVEAQETARMRHIAETDLAEQRALAEKMLKEKMQAIQEASKLRAEAEMLQRQKELAQEQAQKLLEDKQLMQQRLKEETEGFQKSLEAERKRQLEITTEAEKLRLQVSQLSDAQSRAEEEAKKFKKQADEISARLHETELATKEKITIVETLEVQRLGSNKEADDLRKAIADLEKEKAKLKKEAEELQKKSKEMANAQQEQIKQEKTILQQTFMSEKEMLLKKEKQIEDEKKRLESQFEEEVKKSKALKDEQERQRKQMEDDKIKLKATMDAALIKQKEAEQEMLNKQKEMQELERKRLDQERVLAEENQKLREKLQQLEVAQKITQEIQIQTECKKVLNGQSISDEADSTHGFSPLSFDGIREKVPASRLFEIGLLSKMDYDKLQSGDTTVEEFSKTDKLKTVLQGKNCIGGLLVHPNQKMPIYQAVKEKKIAPGTGLVLLEAQAASGYIIDPVKNKKLSVNEAVKEGLIGPELHNKMLSAERAVTGYKDPYTEAKISLFEAMKKGLIGEEHAIRLLEAQIATGGIIDPVNSHRVPNEIAYKQGQFDVATSKILQNPTDDVKGFYDPNTQENLMYQQLLERCVTDPGTGLLLLPISEENCIGGLLVHPNQKMPIYQAVKEKKIAPGTGLVLLEAQAASGYIIDPVKNKKLSVNEAVKEGLIGPELHNKMLSAERAVTGYKDPYTEAKISLFEAMKKGLIGEEHAIRLLEAQIATGGIIDPVNSHRVPNEIAYKQGQFDAATNKILQNPTDDVKGFYDPNTQENLMYQQLLERCVTDPGTGLLLLPISEEAAQNARIFTDEETRDVFDKTTVSVPFGRFKGKTVTIWEIINSEYFTEDQKKDLIRQYKTGKITVEKIIRIVLTVAEEKEKKNELAFDGLRAPVPATKLLESKVIDKDLYNKLQKGQMLVKDVSEMEHVRNALKGSNCIAGVIIDSTKQTMSLYDAMKRDMMRPGPALNLLEAQAATGYVIDPVKNQKLTVDEAVKAGVVGPELHEKLLSAERAVTGYKDPYTGKTISLFEAMKKDLIMKEQGIRLLDAQLATGGIIDPVQSHRIPHDIACTKGCFDDATQKFLSSPSDEVKGYFDPNTQEYLTYPQLYKRCVTDKKTGLQLLPLSEQAISAKEEKYTDAQTKDAMTQATVELQSGPFKGRKVTLWELIYSDYYTEEQRLDLIRQYRSGKMTIEKIIKVLIEIVTKKDAKKQEEGCFKGLRAPVPAKSLFDSKIIDKSTYDLLEQGKNTPKEVSKNASVNKYLQGSESIAGLYLEPTKEKVSIYQAMKRKFLRQNTGIALLEAQAATGFIVDPSRNECLTVDDAVKAGLVGPELHEKLLSAEKAVTGYKDPFTGNKISLFQAMDKDLIPKEHAMPLLEAQLASGGIIDPVNSHRIPVETAIQRGYVTKQLANSIAESKYFSDPASDENVSYKQLKDKCMADPDTGLHLLKLSKPQAPTVVEKTYIYSEEQTQSDLSNTQIDIPIEGQGSMSLWDVMNSNLLPEDQRARLLEEYRSGSLTKERMIIIIIEILEQKEIIKGGNTLTGSPRRRQITIEDLYNVRIIDLETYTLLKKDKKTMRDVMEMQSVKQYLYGTGSVAGVVTDSNSKMSIYQAMKRELMKADIAMPLLEAQAATGFIIDPVRNEMLTVDEAVRKGVVGPELHDKLLSAERAVTGYKDPYSGKVISLFQAMKKDLVPEDYALRLLEAQIATGGIIDPEYNFHLPTEIATQRGHINKETNEKLCDEVKGFVDPLNDEKVSYSQLLKRCKVDKDGQYLLSLGDKRLLFKGLRKEITIEELFRSKIIDEQTISKLYEGLLTMEEVSNSLRKYLEGTSCIAGVFVESTKDRLSIYQAMKKNMIRPGTAFELLEAQAATGYIIDPIKNLKLTVNEAVKMGIVGPEFKDKLLSAERAVTGYKDPYTGKMISLFQAMKKGLILRDHGIRLLEAQIATGGIIDPEQSHRLPVEVAYNRDFFDEEMNEILSDPSDDTKGFFDPNTEENLTYLQLMDRCIVDPDTGLVLLLLKEKKRERTTSSKSSVRKRRVVIVDPDSGKEMSVYEAYRKGLIDHQTYIELSEQECEWEEITITSSEGVEKSILIDRRSGRQYDIDDAIARGLIDQNAIEQYRAGTLSITEFADMLSGNMSGFRSRSSSFGSTSSYPMSPIPSIKTPATVWNDPTEETGPVAGILDTDSLEKVSVTEAIRRNLVDSISGQRLLEAQACTGGIIDPCTGEKFSVAEATEKGLIDKIMVDRLNLAQKAFHGFEDPRTKVRMSAAQALKKGWLYYEAGQRFLEVQYLTGGLIEPEAEGRMSLEEAIRKGAIDGRTAQKLRDVSAYTKYLTCPKTKLKISYKDAMDRSMVEEGSGLRLLEASSVSSKGLYSPYNVSGAASASGSRSGSRTGSRSGSRRGSFDATGSGFSMNFSSSSYTSSSYSRRF
uniref:Plectin b n=1 Tax=Cyprinus carpio TaxID=7962 RepID=A0A8C2I7G8_CYPCA